MKTAEVTQLYELDEITGIHYRCMYYPTWIVKNLRTEKIVSVHPTKTEAQEALLCVSVANPNSYFTVVER